MREFRKTWLVIVLVWAASVCRAQPLTEVRFRIDDNPVPVSQYALSGDILDGNFAVDLTGIAAGTHWLYVEVGAAGQWSLYAKKLIAVEGDIDMALLTQAEYYFDTDPGEGNGYAILLPSDSAVDEQLIITIPPDLSRGVHTLCTRVSDAGGQWSQVVRRKIIIEGATGMVSITGAEYFFDSDPGVGEGYALAIPASSSIDQDLEIPIPGDLSLGTHTMYIRMHDGGTQYAHYVHFPVEICESYPPVAAFDVQPYQGNLYYTFTNQSSLAQESQWSIDGSLVGTDSVFVQLFDAIGNYEVCLEAQNACGVDTQCDTISVLGITDVFGSTGSNAGYCTVHIRGAFVEGAVASLTSDDFPTFVADTTIFVGSDELLAVFNLIGASPGLRDVQVSQDLETYVLPGAFEITTAVIEPIDLTILGRARALAGSTQTFRVDAQNQGNTDAFAVPLLFRNIPQGAVYDITGAVNEMDITQEDY
ncbi:MAG: hypothetical protein JNM00_02760, partial [Flavobacteriales bacterium]|nr:hypothetical protein [Flavobacteriales bacterium]